MIAGKLPLALAVAIPVVAGCQASVGTGGFDYAQLEQAITDELNAHYKELDRQVSGVDCPRQQQTPEAGDTFVCKADLDGNPVRVQVTIAEGEAEGEGKADFKTMDKVFDLQRTAADLEGQISAQAGFPVTVTCGDGLKIVEIAQSFECEAADPQGDTRTVRVTVGPVGGEDSWEIVEQ